jgi:hypothetical protein
MPHTARQVKYDPAANQRRRVIGLSCWAGGITLASSLTALVGRRRHLPSSVIVVVMRRELARLLPNLAFLALLFGGQWLLSINAPTRPTPSVTRLDRALERGGG